MAKDAFDEALRLKSAFQKARGGSVATGKARPDGKAWARSGSLVPQTNWGDVLGIYMHAMQYIDPTMDQCKFLVEKNNRKMLNELSGVVRTGRFAMLMADKTQNPCLFIRTSGFKKERALLDSVSPIAKTQGNPFLLAKKVSSREVYPFNEEFWGTLMRLANERSAAGMLPYWEDLAVSSIVEAIKEAPSTIKNAVSAMNPMNIIPDMPNFSVFADIIKWGSIGGGLLLLYWYVLKPADKKKRLKA